MKVKSNELSKVVEQKLLLMMLATYSCQVLRVLQLTLYTSAALKGSIPR
jgi:hypothetical protein